MARPKSGTVYTTGQTNCVALKTPRARKTNPHRSTVRSDISYFPGNTYTYLLTSLTTEVLTSLLLPTVLAHFD